MRLRSLVPCLLLSLAAVAPAQVKYAQKSRVVKAGVLTLAGAQAGGVPDNPTPHVWHMLDSNVVAKPIGWTFTNPHAPSVLTAEMASRWALIPGAGTVPAAGTRLTKAHAPYWEVELRTASDAQLADYDALLMSVRTYVSLTPVERERLRSFMDQGGLLWVDVNDLVATDDANGPPISFALAAPISPTLTADVSHPLLSSPKTLDFGDVRAATSGTNATMGALAAAPTLGLTSLLARLGPEFARMTPVATDGTYPVLAVANFGDGHLLLSTHGLATNVEGAGNSAFTSGYQRFTRTMNSAANIVINALNLGGSYTQPFGGSRKQGASPVDLGAPLMRTFMAPLNLTPGNKNFVPPATFGGRLVVSSNDRVHVYDANPNRDLDGDGNLDDGIADSNLSSGMDLLWSSAPIAAAPISSPTVVGVANASGLPTKQVYVVDSAGEVHVFDLDAAGAGDLANVAEAAPLISPPGGASDIDLGAEGRGPYALSVHEGIAYVADTQMGGFGSRVGRVWAFDPATGVKFLTGANPWYVGGSVSPGISEISGSPTIGYIPVQDNSGAQDLVMYLPTRPNPIGVGSPDATAGIVSLWLGVRGERPGTVREVGSALEVTTRANLTNLQVFTSTTPDPRGLRVSVVRQSTGVPLTMAELDAIFDGTITQSPPGILTLGLKAPWDADYSLRLDYSIDWGTGIPTATEQIRRGNLFFPDQARTRRVLGSPALGADGNLFVTLSDQTKGGGLWALREEGRGQFRLLYRYELYDQHTINLNQTSPVIYQETILDEDGVGDLVPLVAGQMTGLTMQGAPAVRNGVVYVTATGKKGPFSIPMTILMAFKAKPEPVRIPVGNINGSFVLVQPDVARSTNALTPEVFSIMQPNQFVYEKAGGSGTVRIDNLMASRVGVVQQALSTSQPLVLRSAGQPDVLIQPEASGGLWSPLIWYTVLHGSSTQSPAFVTGDTVFVTGNSKLPDMLATGNPLTAADRGVMFAMDANISPVAPNAYANTVRPWLKQVQFVKVAGPVITPNPVIKWPQTKGVQSFEDWQVRFLQTALKSGDTSFGVAAGDGALFAWGPNTIYGFRRGDLLLADEGRLARLDAGGNPIWSSDTAYGSDSTAQGSTSTLRPLTRPVRAYRLGEDQLVVADPASNRVVRIEDSGRELRSINSIIVDPGVVPEGWMAGSPKTLNAPSDVTVFAEYVTPDPSLTNPQALEYWVHYLVADSGNRRLLELVDRYAADAVTREIGDPVQDASGQPQLGVLVWVSPANVSGKDFRYNSVARVFDSTGNKYVYAGGIGATTPTRSDMGLDQPTAGSTREATTGNGGVVLFDGATTEVVGDITVPAVGSVFWNATAGDFVAGGSPQRVKPLGNVNSVTMRYIDDGTGTPKLAVMVTDASGVYEVYQPTVGPTEPWVVRWMLPKEAFKVLRRTGTTISNANARDLYPTYARRLDSGEVLVVNGYLGKTRGGGDTRGEVLILDGEFDPTNTNTLPGFSFAKSNLGFSSLSLRLHLSDLDGIRDIFAPVFADLR